MKKSIMVIAVLFSASLVFTSCRETKTTEVRIETQDSKGAIERAGEKVDSEVNEEIDKAIDKIDN